MGPVKALQLTMECGWTLDIRAEEISFGPSVDDDEDYRTTGSVQLIGWIRRDGVPATLIHGSPKRILPGPSSEEDSIRLRSLSAWLLSN